MKSVVNLIVYGDFETGKAVCYDGWMDSLSLTDLVTRFRSTTLASEHWTHEAHLKVGAWFVYHYGNTQAIEMLRNGICKLNESHGTPNTETSGYHETITLAYVHLLDKFLKSFADSVPLEELVAQLPTSPLREKSVLLNYWSREVLLSKQARIQWVPPDRSPF
jgi:hypothetical protein